MLTFADNPPMYPRTIDSIEQLNGPWWVAHTKSRFEKALAQDLARQNIGYYLPMVERVSFSGGRKRRAMLPLFTSYLFFCGDVQARQAALATDRVCQVIPVVDRETFVAELLVISQALACNGRLDLYPFAVVGRRCRVKSGPLQGVIGTIIRRDQQARFVLGVSILGQGALLEIDADLLEPVD